MPSVRRSAREKGVDRRFAGRAEVGQRGFGVRSWRRGGAGRGLTLVGGLPQCPVLDRIRAQYPAQVPDGHPRRDRAAP